MKKEEHTALVQELRTITASEKPDVARVTEILTTISEDYGTQLAQVDDFKLKNDKLTNDNSNLQRVNMELFLKVGTPKPQENNGGQPTPQVSFDNLFNEKGDLK
jgi:hypothetical protein